jgi:hypothetical protein
MSKQQLEKYVIGGRYLWILNRFLISIFQLQHCADVDVSWVSSSFVWTDCGFWRSWIYSSELLQHVCEDLSQVSKFRKELKSLAH